MNAPLLEVSALSRSFGGIAAASELSLQVVHGEVHAIIGPNGAGKTTLVSLLAGELRPDSGSIRFCGETITAMPVHARAQRGLARTFQITSIFPEFSAVGNVAMAVQAHANHSFRFWRPVAADMALRQRALEVLQQVGLADAPDRNAGEMSHGEHRLLEMAMALATRPALLLLDEPAAGLGPEETTAMVAILRKLRQDKGILLVEHDMDVVFAIADRITVMVSGRAIATGSPQAIREDDNVRKAYLGEGLHESA
ncbi:MAG: ABC transporter ATP-binding protein [Arenicellales bacterium]|nr:ABC transporter ATP-binding protein [Arenicellales bacterium]MDP6290365.1 ABC transporter ATP-binding protein [Arenicellales bacterium]HJL56806.1 ABC transporter ATP-binding protein [Arenicellales bacterium]